MEKRKVTAKHRRMLALKRHDRRLRRLVKLILSIPKERFDMTVWGAHEGDHDPSLQNHCGTRACALGTAALDPVLRRQGLIGTWVEARDEDKTRQYLRIRIKGHRQPDGVFETARMGGWFFGLTPREAYDLFLTTTRSKSAAAMLAQHYIGNREERTRKPLP